VRNASRIFVGISEEGPVGRSGRRWEDIKRDRRDMTLEGVDLIN
jgi:hypothetical protein